MPNELHEADRSAPAGETATTTPHDRIEADPNRPDGPSSEDTGIASERVDERLQAVERAITGSDAAVDDIADRAAADAERAELESRLDDVEARVEELEAATQALRGYAGSIRAVNREVERRADLALARTSGGDGARPDDRGAAKTEGVPSEDAIDAAIPDDRASGVDGDIGDIGGRAGDSIHGEADDRIHGGDRGDRPSDDSGERQSDDSGERQSDDSGERQSDDSGERQSDDSGEGQGEGSWRNGPLDRLRESI